MIEAETSPNQPLIDLIASWGVQINNDYVLVLDPRFFYVLGGPSAPVVMDFEFHPIMRFQELPIIFQDVRSLTLQPKNAIKSGGEVSSPTLYFANCQFFCFVSPQLPSTEI